MLETTFSELGLSGVAYRIYARLLEYGPSSARQLAEHLNMPRPSVYDHLKTLIQQGLVVESTTDSKKFFSVADTKNVSRLLSTRIDTLAKQKEEIELLLPTLSQNATPLEPKIQFYSGANGIKQILKDMLWYEHIETYTMWPISDMVEILGAEYLADLNRKRIRQHISIKGVWPKDKTVAFKEYPFLGVGKGYLRELRTAPKHMTWDMSYWIYADKVAFISSKKEGFGFIVHSKDFAELLKLQFKAVWDLSKPIKPQPQYTDAFLKTVHRVVR